MVLFTATFTFQINAETWADVRAQLTRDFVRLRASGGKLRRAEISAKSALIASDGFDVDLGRAIGGRRYFGSPGRGTSRNRAPGIGPNLLEYVVVGAAADALTQEHPWQNATADKVAAFLAARAEPPRRFLAGRPLHRPPPRPGDHGHPA